MTYKSAHVSQKVLIIAIDYPETCPQKDLSAIEGIDCDQYAPDSSLSSLNFLVVKVVEHDGNLESKPEVLNRKNPTEN